MEFQGMDQRPHTHCTSVCVCGPSGVPSQRRWGVVSRISEMFVNLLHIILFNDNDKITNIAGR